MTYLATLPNEQQTERTQDVEQWDLEGQPYVISTSAAIMVCYCNKLRSRKLWYSQLPGKNLAQEGPIKDGFTMCLLVHHKTQLANFECSKDEAGGAPR